LTRRKALLPFVVWLVLFYGAWLVPDRMAIGAQDLLHCLPIPTPTGFAVDKKIAVIG